MRRIGAAATLLFLTSSAPADDGLTSPVNVLFVMDDQHNPRALGVDSNGHGGLTRSLTPRLDQLAGEGVRFARSYCASPQCMPSRFSLLTGRHPHVNGLRYNKVWEPAGELTWFELARRYDYCTAVFGKHHMSWLDQPVAADDHGLQEVLDLRDYEVWCNQNGIAKYDDPTVRTYMHGMPSSFSNVGHTSAPNAHHPAGWFSDRTIEFLEDRAIDRRPFAVWLSYHGPHTPILPSNDADPEDWAHRYFPFEDLTLPPNQAKVSLLKRVQKQQDKYVSMTDDQHREALAYYYGYVSQIDHNIGRVLDRLEQLGLDENTVVVFTADHGDCAGELGCWKKGAGCFDCIARVPLMIRLPGTLPAGHGSEVVASAVDLFPTLTELCGFSMEDEERAALSGRSLVRAMREELVPDGWPQQAFVEMGHPSIDAIGRHRFVATPLDKYNFDELGSPTAEHEEYYDLVSDPWELLNRVHDPLVSRRVDELRAALAEWWGDESDHAPLYEVSGDAIERPGPATAPVPADGATLVATDVDPRWLPPTSALTQVAYLGTDPGNLVPLHTLPAMADQVNVGTLVPGQVYYWRVDAVNANGLRTGDVWSFQTDPAGPTGPDLAVAPSPGQGAVDVAPPVTLAWTPAPGLVSQDVWFGADGTLELFATGLSPGAASIAAPPVLGGRTYTWRVDGWDAGSGTVGDEWAFTVSSAGLPGHASKPSPGHLATQVGLPWGTGLRWDAAPGATSYRVYYGTDPAPPLVAETSGESWIPGPLELGQTYFWRVDAVNAVGVRAGFTWRFETWRR